MCGALKQKADGKDEANRYLAGFMAPVVFIQLIRTFSLNFSFAESSVITQAFILLFFNTIHQTLGLAFPNQTGNFVTTNPNYIFHQALIIGMVLVGVIAFPILSKIRNTSVHYQTMVIKEATIKNEVRPLLLILATWKRWVNDKTWMGASLVFYLGFIAFVFGVLTPGVHAFLGENPWIW
ncbi:hypothetical protein BKA69DRAFT_113843 [Paraphysoderma sedebokerense]|nr:hypothetical protein BKA69DRAFT_113843 [Paraphysoderma sedebokerense]